MEPCVKMEAWTCVVTIVKKQNVNIRGVGAYTEPYHDVTDFKIAYNSMHYSKC